MCTQAVGRARRLNVLQLIDRTSAAAGCHRAVAHDTPGLVSSTLKLGSAKDQQRAHALGQFQKQKEVQAQRLEEKAARIKEFEDMATDLKSRDDSLRQHLKTNAPILESYREKEQLMKKQIELLKTRENLAKEGLRNAESRTIVSVFSPGESHLERLKASNAIKKAKCKELREKLKTK